MKTVYSNTSHPKLIKWSSIAAFVVGIACFALYLFDRHSQIINNKEVVNLYNNARHFVQI